MAGHVFQVLGTMLLKFGLFVLQYIGVAVGLGAARGGGTVVAMIGLSFNITVQLVGGVALKAGHPFL